MLSLNYENINYVMTQILKLSCASFSYVNISYVLAGAAGARTRRSLGHNLFFFFGSTCGVVKACVAQAQAPPAPITAARHNKAPNNSLDGHLGGLE